MHNKYAGSHWSSSLLFYLVQELTSFWNVEDDSFNGEQIAHSDELMLLTVIPCVSCRGQESCRVLQQIYPEGRRTRSSGFDR